MHWNIGGKVCGQKGNILISISECWLLDGKVVGSSPGITEDVHCRDLQKKDDKVDYNPCKRKTI